MTLEDIQTRNYNLDIKNPHTEEERYGDPDKLLATYQQHLLDVAELRAQLKAELSAAIKSVLAG